MGEMTVYILAGDLRTAETEEGALAASVLGVTQNGGLNLELEDGAMLIGWLRPVYDAQGNATSPETIRQALAQEDDESQYAQAGRILLGVEE